MKGKSIDQVTDMMVANARNLIITTKPANQKNTLQNRIAARQQLPAYSQQFGNMPNVRRSNTSGHQPPEHESFDSDEEDEVIDHSNISNQNYCRS